MGTNIDYSTVAHQTIFTNITQGPGSGPLMDAIQDCQGLATQLQAVQGSVEQAVRRIGAAQQGAAADAATHATMGLVPWVSDAITAANQMAARVSEQAASFAHTRDSMPPPRSVPDVSFSQDPATWVGDHAVEWLPGIQTEHERAQVAAQQDEQRARDLMNGYQGTSNDNLATSAQFTPAPTVVADVTDPRTPTGAGGGAGAGGWSGPPTSAHAGTSPGGHGGAVAPAATASQLVSNVHPMPAPAATSPQLADGYPANGGSGPSPLRPAPAAAAGFGAPLIPSPSAVPGGYRRGGGSRFTGGAGGGGRASRGGGFGPRPSAPAERPVSEASRMAGHSSTARPGSRSGGGFGDAPLGAPGGRGKGGGDTEHKRPSYLVEHDTNAIVGDLPPVAPAVIGADEDYW